MCEFEDNQAVQGGAIYFDCSIDAEEDCKLNVKDGTIFNSNKAQIQGGAIDYNLFPPILTDDTQMISNEAQYGNRIGGYGFKLNLISPLISI